MATQLLDDKAADRTRSAPAKKTRRVWSSNPVVVLWGTMVGKKVVMAVTGLVLFGFVIGHVLGNLKIFLGAEVINTYAVFLRTMGEPMFPNSFLLWVVRIFLFTCVVLHITAVVQLTRMNGAARPRGYDTKRSLATTFAAQTMRWSGVVLALFIVIHLLHLMGGLVGFQPGGFVHLSVYHNVVAAFSLWYLSLFLHCGDGLLVPASGSRHLEHVPDGRLEQCPDHRGPQDPVAGGGAGSVPRLCLRARCRDGRVGALRSVFKTLRASHVSGGSGRDACHSPRLRGRLAIF